MFYRIECRQPESERIVNTEQTEQKHGHNHFNKMILRFLSGQRRVR